MYAQLTLKQTYWYAILHFRLRCPIPILSLFFFYLEICNYKKRYKIKIGKNPNTEKYLHHYFLKTHLKCVFLSFENVDHFVSVTFLNPQIQDKMCISHEFANHRLCAYKSLSKLKATKSTLTVHI